MRYSEDDRGIMTRREGDAMDRYITGNYGEDQLIPGPIICSLMEGEQLEVWGKAFPDKQFVVWTCPDCETENIDSPDTTAVPMCFDCEAEFDWWEFDCLERGNDDQK